VWCALAAVAEEPVEGKEAPEVMAARVPSVSSGELVEASLQLTQVMFEDLIHSDNRRDLLPKLPNH